MSVNIKEKKYISFIADDLLFDVVYLWVHIPTGKDPLPVDIISRVVRAIVSTDDSIYIYHRNYSKFKLLP